ncbi:MAG: arylsulfatase [Dehalococcoidia bacterium]|nr:arylsulfatase [Dehalococcoidia bacterium]
MEKPNIIILMADQLRFDLVGEHTPNINALVADSMSFTRAYCTSPLCVPARGSFFTGKYPNTSGSLINPWDPRDGHHGQVKARTPNLYSLLDGEWDSWHTGKQHLKTEDDFDRQPGSRTHWSSLEKGYASMLEAAGKRKPGGPAYRGAMPEMAYGTTTRLKKYSIPTTGCYPEGLDYFFDGYIKNTSLEAIENRDRSKPFMLNTMFIAPHPPLEIPEPFYSQIRGVDMPENVGLWGAGQSPLQLYNLTGYLGTRYSRADWQEIWDVYAGLVALLDHCIGEIIRKLKDEGMYDNSLILWTADHGEMLGSHCLWQKMCMYEESTHVPLSFKLPKGTESIDSSDEIVSHVDILPTLCDYAGVATPPGIDGLSLKKTIETGASIDRDHVFIQFDGNGARGNFQRSVIHGSHKLIVDLFKDEVYFELYDVLTDPQEKYNLAFTQQDRVRELSDLLREWMRDTGDLVSYVADDYDHFLDAYQTFQEPEPYYPIGEGSPNQIGKI